MSLYFDAKRYAENPSDINVMAKFIDSLAQEKSIEEIKKTLSLDVERVSGLALLRLAELLPCDVELLLSVALWHYHFGLDDEAHKYLEKSKSISPFDLHVLQMEIFFSYGEDLDDILSLCRSALNFFPKDKWILNLKQKIEQTGKLDELKSPPINSKWHKLLFAPSP